MHTEVSEFQASSNNSAQRGQYLDRFLKDYLLIFRRFFEVISSAKFVFNVKVVVSYSYFEYRSKDSHGRRDFYTCAIQRFYFSTADKFI